MPSHLLRVASLLSMLSCGLSGAWASPKPPNLPNDEHAEAPNPDVESYDGLMVRTFFVMPNLSLRLKHRTRGDDTPDLKFSPNVTLSGGLGVAHGDYGLALSMRVGEASEPEAEYGETRYHDVQLYYYAQRFGLDFFYQRYDGFYLEDPDTVDPGCEVGQPCALRPGLSMGSLGMSAYYIHSESFSFPAAFAQTARQINSGGSWLAIASASRMTFDNDGAPLIPASQAAHYGDEAGLESGTFYSLSLAPGYAHSWVNGGYYFTPALFAGGGIQHQRYDLGVESRDGLAFVVDVNIKTAAGYNGERFFTGLTAQGHSTGVQLEEIDLSIMVISVEMFVGLRL